MSIDVYSRRVGEDEVRIGGVDAHGGMLGSALAGVDVVIGARNAEVLAGIVRDAAMRALGAVA